MQKVVLPNGLKVIYQPKKGNSVVVEVMIEIGSNYEKPEEKGIAHFLEHMLFEGTKNRPTNQEITNEIEKIGGYFNAYTTNERTCFHVKVLKKHFTKAVEILADILSNPLFKEENLEREKNIVLKEIDMVHDEPSFYQWILLQKNLFEVHPCKNPTYGDRNIIKSLTKEKVQNYFRKYYVTQNMVISIVGDVKNWKSEVKKWFTLPKGAALPKPTLTEPPATKSKSVKEKRKIMNTYMVMGFKTVPRNHPDIHALEVINGILGRGQSGRIFTEIRSKRGMAYEVGTQNVGEVSFGFFAIYATIDKKNLKIVQDLMMEEIKKLSSVSPKDVKESQDYIEGDYLLGMEDPQKLADQILTYEQLKDAKLMENYIKNIRKVTPKDVRRVAEKYFKHHTIAIIQGKQ